jgi:hypothetical protein
MWVPVDLVGGPLVGAVGGTRLSSGMVGGTHVFGRDGGAQMSIS